MIKPFQIYFEEGAVEQQSPDPNQASALMHKAEKRLAYVQERPVQEAYAEFVFEDAYDVMRESSHSIMVSKGYKPLTHEAVIAFLRDRESLSQSDVEQFDRFRKLRNKSLYSAQKISVTTSREAIDFAGHLLRILKNRMN